MPDLDSYIKQKSPIEYELKHLFEKDSSLTLFDIGSCEGEDSIKYSILFPNSKIWAFEPLPKNQLKAKKNFDHYKTKNITLSEYALSDNIGVVDFFVSSGQPAGQENNTAWDYGNKSSSLLPPDKHLENHEFIKFSTVIKAETTRIDDFCKKNNILTIDFIHMDVQGAELKVLRGAGDFIHNVKAIWLEVSNVSLYKNQPLKDEIEKYMLEKGFLLMKNEVGKISGDRLYVNQNFYGKNFIRTIRIKGLIYSLITKLRTYASFL